MRKYPFSWELIGNTEVGRPNLGATVDLDIYRLMQYTLRDVISLRYGDDEADAIYFEAGRLAGTHFYEKMIAPVVGLDEFISKTQRLLKEKRIGILRIESEDVENGSVMLTIDEDTDCSGMPEIDYETCIYDEGFVSALFTCFTGHPWLAKEIDCWCTGARTCRFSVKLKKEM